MAERAERAMGFSIPFEGTAVEEVTAGERYGVIGVEVRLESVVYTLWVNKSTGALVLETQDSELYRRD